MASGSSSNLHYKADPDEIPKVRSTEYIFKPRGLDIVWGRDRRYWIIPEKDKEGPAELIQVCWLEVTASIPISLLEDGKKYTVSFNVSLKPGAFGWSDLPIYLLAKIGKKGKYKWTRGNLGSTVSTSPSENMCISLEIENKNGESGDKLNFGLYEVWRGRWKGGLLIHGAKIAPVI